MKANPAALRGKNTQGETSMRMPSSSARSCSSRSRSSRVDGGSDTKQLRQVTVRAGSRVTVDFNTPYTPPK